MNVISLEGGGTHGKAQAVALRQLEAMSSVPLFSIFASVSGTSVGSIIGAAVSKAAPKIFAGSFWNTVSQLWGAKYSAAALETGLQTLLGTHTLSDCKTKFIATAFDTVSGRNVYFQSYGSSSEDAEEIVITPDTHPNLPLWQICRASAAAQTYFPAFKLDNMVLIDGGNTGCNAPDMLCITEALDAGVMPGDIKMLSIGGGKVKWDVNGSAMVNPCVLRAGLNTISIVFAGSEHNSVWMAESLLGANYYRLDADLGDGIAIDDASQPALDTMTTAMMVAISKQPKMLTAFAT
jgi:patatin-like phospholipase/acyl hydrolase